MRRLLVVSTLLAAIALTPIWTTAHGQFAGTIRGRVLNGTAAGASVSELTVSLSGFDAGGAPLPGLKAATDSKGSFLFSDLAAGAYRVAVAYRDVSYASEDIQLKEDSPSAEIEVSVFETVTSDSAIRGRLDHLVLSFESGVMTVMELIQLENTGNSTIVMGTPPGGTSPKPTLRVPIPPGVTEVSVIGGLSDNGTIALEDVVADLSPVLPGSRDVAISYTLPFTTSSFTLRKTLAYPTDKVTVLLPDDGVRARSAALPDAKKTVLDGRNYQVLSRQGVEAGAVIEIELSNLAVQSSGASQTKVLFLAAAAAVILVAVALIARKRASVRTVSNPDSEGPDGARLGQRGV